MIVFLFLFCFVTLGINDNDNIDIKNDYEDQPCTTIGGPGAGQPCQFPFIYAEVTRGGCITEADPEGRAWCSTKVDTEGRHVAGGEHWAHCHPGCPMSVSDPGGSEAGQSSSAFTVRMRCLKCVVMINVLILYLG